MKYSIFVIFAILYMAQARHVQLKKRQINTGFDYIFDEDLLNNGQNPQNQIGGQNNQFGQLGTQGNQLGGQGQLGGLNNPLGVQTSQFGSQGQPGVQNGQLFNQNNQSGGQGSTAVSTTTPVTTTLPSRQLRECIANCRTVTSEYNPVCGSNGVRYGNLSALRCAQSCGARVQVTTPSRCP